MTGGLLRGLLEELLLLLGCRLELCDLRWFSGLFLGGSLSMPMWYGGDSGHNKILAKYSYASGQERGHNKHRALNGRHGYR